MVIEHVQQRLKLFLEEEILSPLLHSYKIEEPAMVQWNETFDREEVFATKLQTLAGIEIEGKPIITWEEAREMLRLPSPQEGLVSRHYSQSSSKEGASPIEVCPAKS